MRRIGILIGRALVTTGRTRALPNRNKLPPLVARMYGEDVFRTWRLSKGDFVS